MRLTFVLGLPQRVKRLKDASWQRWRKRIVTNTNAEEQLREAGIPVFDANEFVRVREDNPLFIDYNAIPDAKPIFPQPPSMDRNHPNWHDIPCRIFDDSSFPIEGIRQAQAFTNAVQIKQGLPHKLIEFGFSTKLDEQDARIEKIIRQAYLWDAYMEKLPKLRILDMPAFIPKREYGIPQKRSNEIVVRNFLQMIEKKFTPESNNRIVTGEYHFRLNMNRHDSMVQLKLQPLITVLSKQHIEPFADTESVLETENMELPSIKPFLSTANIEDSNIYETTDVLGFKQNNPYPNIHTTFFSHHIPGSHTHIHPRWNDDRFTGTTNMYAFAVALLMARQKFGVDVKTIEEPITSQVVHLTGREFQFAVFQLNTLNLEDSRVKNILWITDKIPLFDVCRYDWGKEIFEGYNPDIFKIILGMYGMSLS